MWRPYRRRTQPNLAAGEVSIDELAAMVGLEPRALAGQADAEPPTHESIPDEGLSAPPEPVSSAAAGADSDWRSIPLVAGLELRVRRDAPPLVQRIAESIARGDWLP